MYHMHIYATACGGQKTACGSPSFPYHVSSGDQTRLGGKHPYLLRDLTGALCYDYCLICLLSLNLNLFSLEH